MLRHDDFELAGRVPEPDGEGFAGGSACGDRVRITLALAPDGTIAAARFGASACAHATAAAAWACRRSQGHAFLEAARASLADCAEELGLAGHARDCAAVALDALHAALGDAAEHALALAHGHGRVAVALSGGAWCSMSCHAFGSSGSFLPVDACNDSSARLCSAVSLSFSVREKG